MRRSLLVLSVALCALAASVLPSAAVVRTDEPQGSGQLRSHALVRLVGDPVSVAAKTKPAQGKKINYDNTTVKSYRATLSARRNEFKRWLQANAPKAQVTKEFDIALNAVAVALNGTSLSKLRESSLVAEVQYEGLYRMASHDDPDLDLVNGFEGWAANESAGGDLGEGIKIGIIDAGIAEEHPCFDGTDYPAVSVADPGQTQYTNDKVIVAKVFHNKTRQLGLDPEPTIEGHGTHVAGTAACEEHTDAEIDGVEIPYDPSGVAPRAFLGNYNVFPNEVADARSEDILDAMDEAAEDGMDVMNMSLGGPASGRQDLLTMAVDNLDRANIVMAVAAGNEGPGHFTLGSPGSAALALTAGASSVGHSYAQHVSVNEHDFDAVRGDFAEPDHDVSGSLEVVAGPSFHGLSEACEPLPAGSLTGKIGLVTRGTCDFTDKVRNAQNAGAIGVIVANRIEGEEPFTMSHNGVGEKPTIPAYMIGYADSTTAVAEGDGAATTLYHVGQYKTTPHTSNRMAEFSSQGPSDVTFLVKPDLVAPGANVLSAYPGDDCGDAGCWSFLGGTSMASPHLAGASAIVRDAHPSWSSAEIRSAITNTAERNVLKTSDGANLTDVMIEGAGLLQLDDAVNASVALNPVSVSFGRLPAGSGQTRTATVSLKNLTGSGAVYSLAAGAPYTVSASTVSLAAGETKSVTVKYASTRGVTGDISSYLTVSSMGGEVAHMVLYTLQQ